MIILLEGADCSGKTTLSKTILDALKDDVVYIHHTEKSNSVSEFTNTLDLAAKRLTETGQWTVIDRLWISEMIYGPFMRDTNRDPDGIVARLCRLYGVVTVMCVRDDIDRHIAHFRETEKTRHEYAGKVIESIIKAYYDLWHGILHGVSPEPFPRGTLYYQLSRYTPLNMLRSFYQYDMDKYTAEQFTNWLIRLRSGR